MKAFVSNRIKKKTNLIRTVCSFMIIAVILLPMIIERVNNKQVNLMPEIRHFNREFKQTR